MWPLPPADRLHHHESPRPKGPKCAAFLASCSGLELRLQSAHPLRLVRVEPVVRRRVLQDHRLLFR